MTLTLLLHGGIEHLEHAPDSLALAIVAGLAILVGIAILVRDMRD